MPTRKYLSIEEAVEELMNLYFFFIDCGITPVPTWDPKLHCEFEQILQQVKKSERIKTKIKFNEELRKRIDRDELIEDFTGVIKGLGWILGFIIFIIILDPIVTSTLNFIIEDFEDYQRGIEIRKNIYDNMR